MPQAYGYVTEKHEAFWETDGQGFPPQYQSPGHCYFSERVLPIPKNLRHALIDMYFPEGIREIAKRDFANNDCLLRVYLGKRQDLSRQKPVRATLRNYNLHLDQMQELGLDINHFASIMANALATMHWKVGIDADDVEFVLGTQPTLYNKNLPFSELEEAAEPMDTYQLNFGRRTIQMFLIDFNRCQFIYVDKERGTNAMMIEEAAERTPSEQRTASIEQAVNAFFRNDPYFPRPLCDDSQDEELWQTFQDAYLARDQRLLAEKDKEIQMLPQYFIGRAVEEMKIRKEKKLLAEERLRIRDYHDGRFLG